ncbi:EAL domain-containing protein [Shewanella eurypsychrophilus]|uniref:EAL domain-containing protein n=1 Tax=Shewanella eurypsychrophilus TaxID=2593656 RepID=A0ABX6V7Y5_9GAMM|nr:MULTISPECIES: EAL domain-containing protein [Shewanella]QFU22666.1 EAL domain-containing protein [Shewanella sp. YLB-09]QPG57955.1 EAL domain-containing protein [Shewanella eurypsychrophilus]
MNKSKYQYLLETIVNSKDKQDGNFKNTSELATELLCQHLEVNYVGVCIISCEDRDMSLVADAGLLTSLKLRRPIPSDCPNYITELRNKRLIDVTCVEKDARVSELTSVYFNPKGVKSTLDIAIRINGHLEGVLYLERDCVWPWSESEIHVATHVADQLALTLATRNADEKDERLMLLLSADEQSDQVSILINLKTDQVEYINQAHEFISGTPKHEVIGQSYKRLDFIKQNPEEADAVLAKIAGGVQVKGESKITRLDGKTYWLRYSVKQFITDRGNHYALVKADDISDEKQYQVNLERLAWRCSLTGLYNRGYFNKELDKTQSGQLILIDLCGFKRFNDTYGHESGDELLVEVARRLKHFADVNKTKQLARVGSDEFAVIIHLNDRVEIDYLISRLYTQLTQTIIIGREHIQPKPALAIVDIASVEEQFVPLACADIAIQYAKKKQGDTIQVFNNALLNAFKEDTQIERDLQTALRGREFELYYQPLKDLKKKSYIGAEALIRWHHPKKGILYPGAFIDIAEQTGMINAIGTWVLEAACKQLNLWQHHHIDISMHVNVSARQFFSGNLFDQVWNLMSRYRLKPGSLILEITETELMEDIKYATRLCTELSELGVGLAIDDFGTGYSSMRYLKQFPISKLKIDRSFISDLTVSRESREIVSAIIAMATALNISLTAEGVETKEQEKFLSDHLCHQAQGFLYSPALREADFYQFIRNASPELLH